MPDELPDLQDVDLDTLESATLARLIDEVRHEATEPVIYNRTHNRHNRGATIPWPGEPDDKP